jgi:hypothetical protein
VLGPALHGKIDRYTNEPKCGADDYIGSSELVISDWQPNLNLLLQIHTKKNNKQADT